MIARLALLGVLCFSCLTLGDGIAMAQPTTLPHARLWTITPSGGQAGATTRVTLTGLDLEECRELRVSQAGIRAQPAPDPKKPGGFLPLQFDISIEAGAALGRCDVRAVGRYGISNPRVFTIGVLPEIAETEPNNDLPQAQALPLNCVVSGAIAAPSDVDFFKLQGERGQTVVLHCAAESIDSWLDPELQVYDIAGRRLASNRRFHGREAELGVRFPATGPVFVRLCQHAHQSGDAHHFYRLTVTTSPWAVMAFPPVLSGEAGSPAQLLGYNLPDGAPETDAAPDEPLQKLLTTCCLARDSSSFRPSCAASRMLGLRFADARPAGVVNPLPFLSTQTPIVAANEAAEDPKTGQTVGLPCAIAGRLGRSGRQHWFRCHGKKNEMLIAEVIGDRLGSSEDLYLQFRRTDTGQILAEFDDSLDALQAPHFFARTEDPKARLVFPADGNYLIGVGRRDHAAGAAHYCPYVLALRPERPDFRLVAVDAHPQSPGAWQLARGTQRFLEVFVQRKEGFAGPVVLSAESLPAGISALPQVIAAGATQTQFVVTIAADAPDFVGPIRLVGDAAHNGEKIHRNVEAGCMVWPNPGEPNGVPAWSRLCHELAAAVREGPPFTVHTGVEQVHATPGGTVPLSVRVKRIAPEAGVPLNIVPLVLPPGAVFNGNNAPVPVQPGQSETSVAVILPGNLAAGPCQITLAAVAQIPFSKDAKAAKAPVQVVEAAQPISVEVHTIPAEVKLAPPPTTAPTK